MPGYVPGFRFAPGKPVLLFLSLARIREARPDLAASSPDAANGNNKPIRIHPLRLACVLVASAQ